MKKVPYAVIVSLLSCSPLAYSWPNVTDTVAGKVEGMVEEQVNVWKGIDYAAPPVGKLRWQAPSPVTPWSGIKPTKKSIDFTQLGYTGLTGVEDALTLDVYRPNTDKKDLPVIFYVHGGNNQSGSSTELIGQHFVNDLDVILVSVNYRLGVLGFNPLPAIAKGEKQVASGNYGLLDIAAALDWVDNNIAQFGGDKDNITVAGFSAGGRDVLAMLISPVFEDKFAKAISLSGGMTLADKQMSATVFARNLAPLAIEDGIKNDKQQAIEWLLSDSDEVRDYLQQVDAGRLASLMAMASIRMAQFPHLYIDGHVIPEQGFDTAVINSVPLMLLSGANEFTSFAKWEDQFHTKLKEANPPLWNQYQFVTKYGNAFYHQFNTHQVADKISDNYSAPIYIASVSVASDPLDVGHEAAHIGAYHGIWKPLLTQQDPGYFEGEVSAALAKQGGVELSNAFRDYIKQFAHTGTPSATDYSHWPEWKSSGEQPRQQLVFDATDSHAVIYPESNHVTTQGILELMDKDRSLTSADKHHVIRSVLNGRWFSGPIDQHYNLPSLW